MCETTIADVYLLHFEAHRYGQDWTLVGIDAAPSPGDFCFSFRDTTQAFLTEAAWRSANDSADGNWFAINGSFVLPADFDVDHPIFRCLVALGLDADEVARAVKVAMSTPRNSHDSR
jgi:hypothetical protein